MENIDITQFPGLVASPVDELDYIASGAVSQEIKRPEACPAPFDLLDINQFSKPETYYSCVACAMAGLRQIQSRLQGVTEDYDYEWLYNQCKLIDGLAPGVKGTTLRAVLSVAKNTGIKTINGKFRKIKSYKRIENPNDQAQIETAIFLHRGVLAAVTLSDAGWRGETVRKPLPGEKTAGHGIILNGYDPGAYLCQDSMPSYHSGDIFRMQKNYPINEAWEITLDDEIPLEPPAPGSWGYVAKEYIRDGIVISRTGLKLRITPNGNIVKILPFGTKVKEFVGQSEVVNGIWWQYVEIL